MQSNSNIPPDAERQPQTNGSPTAREDAALPQRDVSAFFSGQDMGLPFATSFPEVPSHDTPLPPMPGKLNAGVIPGWEAGESAGLRAGDSLGAFPLPGDTSREEKAGAQQEAGGARGFLRALFYGSEQEQKPDKSLRDIWKDFWNRATDAPGEGGQSQQSRPGLFTALDAPLNGLTPDDIQFASEVDAALARRPRFGARALSICVAVMFACLILWAAFAHVDEVTHAEGSVVGSQRTQAIQNLEGGILRAVLVHEGQTVEKNSVLAQLDNEMAESSYRDAVNKALENSLAIVRLEAEIRGVRPAFPKDMEAWTQQVIGRTLESHLLGHVRQIIRDQENAWDSRQRQVAAEIEILESQYTQRMHDVEEQTALKVQLDRSLALAIQQQETAHALVQRNNFSKMEYLGLQQRVVDLQGQIASLAATIPRAQAAAEEAKQRVASRNAEYEAAITEEINKRRQELNSLRESLSAGRDRVTRTELRAPVRGTVRKIYISTVGGVVKPGESIMDIVPLDDTLLVEARVKPQDVAFLRPGQEVMVKVSAYDFSIYGGLPGTLESISADTIEDKRGDQYYLVKARTQKNAIIYRNQTLPIIPGMIVTADILIGKKTVLDYLLKPILKAQQNALRER